MAEELTLTTPITKTSTSTYRVAKLDLSTGSVTEGASVNIIVISNNEERTTINYSGQTAKDYITFINTGNFTVTSLQKRILQRLVSEGKLPPGNVTGAPE